MLAHTVLLEAAFDYCGKKGIKNLAAANTGGKLLGSMA